MTETRSWVFGTAPDCDVVVTDEYVSPRHCRVTLHENGAVTVEDLGSANGTRIIGPGLPPAKITGEFPIGPGWIIRIGHTDIPWRRP